MGKRMEASAVLDSCVLIDYFRTKHKNRSVFALLKQQYGELLISSVTVYEVLVGAAKQDLELWEGIFNGMRIIPLSKVLAELAASIGYNLRKRGIRIDLPDAIIAATALQEGVPLATLNRRHFDGVEGLEFVEQEGE